MTTAAGIVSSDHLSKWYGQVIGLNDVSVVVPPGITGLLGPNGAGKSTFMKLITGQLKPSKGSVTVLGEPIWRNPGLYARIARSAASCSVTPFRRTSAVTHSRPVIRS